LLVAVALSTTTFFIIRIAGVEVQELIIRIAGVEVQEPMSCSSNYFASEMLTMLAFMLHDGCTVHHNKSLVMEYQSDEGGGNIHL
jgi:hypothetical protein